MGEMKHFLMLNIFLGQFVSGFFLFFSTLRKNVSLPFHNSNSTGFKKCDFRTSPSPVSRSTFCRGPRALLTLALLASTLFFYSLPAFASAGGEPGAFLQWGAGARSLGMGRAFLAVSDDASATYWNPAAMTQLKRKELMGLQATLFKFLGL